MSKKQLLLLSSSTVHGFSYLEYAATDIKEFLQKNQIKEVLFIPYALKDHGSYLEKVKNVFTKWGFNMTGIHESKNPFEAVKSAKSVFVGGGNTFLLLKTLYDHKLIDLIRSRVMNEGLIYMGTSAGTNIATKSIHTTNDMPIVYPPSFDALNLVPFNINPHYVDPEANSKHKGETREERILQFLETEHGEVVLGLREGSTLLIEGNKAVLKGLVGARLFVKGQKPQELEVGTDLSYLMDEKECLPECCPKKKVCK
ncbi:probable alpha-aspartyl dipeptidase [Coccinella septempunctata]|uniref:probable alpha-aspartyl dipeptidase n=1 Tax=Coccinella septempunctata TaxID=41139 RepID=UPI001D0638D1|nr:probable alpha-aspartyl dipeptidase [Coccinella septempunctata]